MPEFAVWAPLPEQMRLDLDGQLHDMTVDDGGWWRADVDAAADARYGFVLDDDPTVLPDPRSARQPDGVHERSQLWDPSSAQWSDTHWAGRPSRVRSSTSCTPERSPRKGHSTPPSRSWTIWWTSASTSSS